MNTKTQRINWESVRSRLAESQVALDRALVADAARTDGVFERRATQLASRRTQVGGASALKVPVQVFVLGEQRFGIELSDLVEVIAFSKCTPIPAAPPEYLGVINLRGEIRLVADLARLLGLGNVQNHPRGYILLVGKRGHEVGFRVDRLEQILLIRFEELGKSSDTDARYLKAFTSDKLSLIDAGAILQSTLFTTNHQI